MKSQHLVSLRSLYGDIRLLYLLLFIVQLLKVFVNKHQNIMLIAMTVCTRPAQQWAIGKCSTQSQQTNVKTFQFTEENMYGGVLDTFALHSRTARSGICSSNDMNIAITYSDEICTLYM
jgi:hypothetical protein